ncbi:Uncharacterised protein [Bordetella pertussis]|nr:Uncharacterised protein [Bordetella pertussis]
MTSFCREAVRSSALLSDLSTYASPTTARRTARPFWNCSV